MTWAWSQMSLNVAVIAAGYSIQPSVMSWIWLRREPAVQLGEEVDGRPLFALPDDVGGYELRARVERDEQVTGAPGSGFVDASPMALQPASRPEYRSGRWRVEGCCATLWQASR